MLYRSTGTVEYGNDPYKLTVLIDRDLYLYYRALMPRSWNPNGQRYAPHISVVRNEIPPRLDLWGKYRGEEVEFFYDGIIQQGEVYYWLNVFSTRLEEIRVELGLPVSSMYTLPPEGFTKCFHTTIGNKKGV